MSAKNLPVAARPAANRYQLKKGVLTRIWLERLRQKQLLRQGTIKFDCASPIVSNDRKLRVCTEELGEVAQAIDHLENADPIIPNAHKNRRRHLQEELTQLAAVTIAWLEAIEEELK